MTTGRIDQINTSAFDVSQMLSINMASTTIFHVSIATYMASVLSIHTIYQLLTIHTNWFYERWS